jgi:hypothetical protein
MSGQEVEISFYISLEGTVEDAAKLRDQIDDAVYDLLNINCGEPECCPEPPAPGEAYVYGAVSSSTINPIQKEEDE